MAGAAELNKTYFNDEAAKYDSKHEKSLQQLTEAIQARLDFIGADWAADDEDQDDNDRQSDSKPKQSRLLDYACGTGMISRALASYTTQCVGIDISENMVAAYNARAENQGLTKDDMYAVAGNLTVPDDPKPAHLSDSEFFGFDLAAVGGGFHHFDDPQLTAIRLVERLRPGGVLFIWDFLTHEADEFTASKGVTHHGFSEEQIRAIFEKAGAGQNFGLQELGSGVVFGHSHEGKTPLKRHAFLARGEKA
ncbi:putative S-adenosyl-L-methionine-dependent methyltransferase [Seiridium cardinale]|uniref:S-adenosyl-L-methionine-dependent methyltransferase n=1 Tax=Seiridium cardinale TaxID=138064 RepID=A0ABR2XU00_9PEZI